MKTKLTWLFWLAAIGCVVWYVLHQHQTQVKEQRAAEIHQEQTVASINAFALRYNAVTNWESSLPDRGIGSKPFSFEISRALILSNGQPVLITMDLEDITEEKQEIHVTRSKQDGNLGFVPDSINGTKDKYIALFGKYDITNGTYQFSVELKCTQEQVDQLLSRSDGDFFQNYAVIAQIDKVDRPRFKVSGIGGEDASIELDDSSDLYLIKGELLDAIRLSQAGSRPLPNRDGDADDPDADNQ
jgi:hypothetical protein